MSNEASDGWETRSPGDGGDPVQRMVAGGLVGVVVQGALSAAEIEALLAACAGLTPHAVIPGEPAVCIASRALIPTMLLPNGPDLDDYFAEAERDAPTLEPVLPLVHRLFGACTDLPIRLLRRPRRHTVGTLRRFSGGLGAPLHCDTYRPSPSFTHLHRHTDRSVQLSWYLVVGAPESGGVLLVDNRLRTIDVEPCADLPIPLAVGDGVVFDGANHFHEITPAMGEAPRLTFGGFAGLSPKHDRLLFWG